jgi:hypothetical protein
MRHEFQTVMTKHFTDTIEKLTGRNVLAFLSQAHVDPDITIEIFFVDGSLEGFGAIEITAPNSADPGGHVAAPDGRGECFSLRAAEAYDRDTHAAGPGHQAHRRNHAGPGAPPLSLFVD